jgi:hypothetical protein
MVQSILEQMRRVTSRGVVCFVLFGAAAISCARCAAADETLPPPARPNAAMGVRSGGVLGESYNYHRQQPTLLQPMRSAIERGGIPQANGWYNYGFPMQSYRYGWFGAERHDPRVFWHKGYYGDELRTAYRYRY